MPRHQATAAVLAALGLAACACRASAGPPRVIVLDDSVKLGADGRILAVPPLPAGYLERNPAWDGRAVTLAGARGETVAFQVAVSAAAAALAGVDVTLSPLVHAGGRSLPADACARFREWYVEVTLPSLSPGGSAGPGAYPDALVPAAAPRLGLPVDVAAGRTQAVWIDCTVPRDAPAGAYRGTLAVTAGATTLARHAVVLEVYPFALPAERHLRWRVGYSGWEAVPAGLGLPEESPGWLELERDLYRLLWEGHRIAPTTHYTALRLPVEGGRLDWTAYDRRFGGYLDGSAFGDGVPLNVFSLPVNPMRGWPFRLPEEAGRVDAAALEALAREVGRHWDERGWRLEDAFVYVADEPAEARWPAVRRACEALRRGEPRLRTSVAFYTEFGRKAAQLVEAFTGRVTDWDVAGDYLDLPALRARQAAGDRVGFYQGGEPFQGSEALDGDGLSLVTWPWIAWRYGLDQLFLYNATEWTYFRLDRVRKPWSGGKREIWENPLNQSWQTNSQGVLVYPGAYAGVRGVVPSIRLKQARRGMQDYEYLWLAARGGGRALADAVARRLVPRALHEAGPLGEMEARGAWERDPRAWAAARADLARAIAAARGPQGSPGSPPPNGTPSAPSTR